MAFTTEQRQALSAKLDGRAVRERVQNGQTVSYLEGWYALSQANRIFGFEGWDRETVNLRCVWEGKRQGRIACAYLAQVRVRVRAANTTVCRDGHGSGTGSGNDPGEAHEAAAKEAETDATKRALVTFGNAFGLCLYDKAQSGLRRSRQRKITSQPIKPIEWTIRSQKGQLLTFPDPVQFCSALRKLITDCASDQELSEVWSLNAETVSNLAATLPALRTEKNEHYADILNSVYRKQLAAIAPVQPSVARSNLMISAPRRVRDKGHLRIVAKHPCLICGRAPSHAHHLRFAQPRALGRKPSDEYSVPLCRLHHRAVHETGDEEGWWRDNRIDPLAEAEKLWTGSRGLESKGHSAGSD
jgi:DNA recombination protein Rad52